jgi:Lipocalin-like domain
MKSNILNIVLFLFLLVISISCDFGNHDSVSPKSNSIIGKWKQTKLTETNGSSTQAELNDHITCEKNIVYEFTATQNIISGINCQGYDYKNYNISYKLVGNSLTIAGQTSTIELNGNTLVIPTKYGTITRKTTFTRL